VDRVASVCGVRVLFIKGPVLDVQGLRPPRDSVDVDVLVDPGHFDEMLDGLTAVGWYPYIPLSTELLSAPEHSATLKHDAWPCSLDLHHYFPGCLAPAQQVFDELWARRTTVELGGRDLPCPDVSGSSVIAGLNSLRSPDSWREKAELAHLTRELDQRLGDTERAELAKLAERMGAGDTLRPLLEALGIHPDPAIPRYSDGLAAWHLLTVLASYPTLLWLEELRQTPWHRRPAVLWRAVLLTEEEIRNFMPDLPAGRWGLTLGRLKRIRQRLPLIPKAAMYLAKSRGFG
jgi:Uncharacterised nucleotidyltransferase